MEVGVVFRRWGRGGVEREERRDWWGEEEEEEEEESEAKEGRRLTGSFLTASPRTLLLSFSVFPVPFPVPPPPP